MSPRLIPPRACPPWKAHPLHRLLSASRGLAPTPLGQQGGPHSTIEEARLGGDGVFRTPTPGLGHRLSKSLDLERRTL